VKGCPCVRQSAASPDREDGSGPRTSVNVRLNLSEINHPILVQHICSNRVSETPSLLSPVAIVPSLREKSLGKSGSQKRMRKFTGWSPKIDRNAHLGHKVVVAGPVLSEGKE